MPENGKPTLQECMLAFLRIVDILDGTFDARGDEPAKQACDIAVGFYRDLGGKEPHYL